MRPGERRVPYASTRRFGVILPSQNTVAEPEFYRVAPPGVTFHFARVPLERGSDGAMLNVMAEAALAAAALLRDARPECIAYACMSGSLVGGPGSDLRLANSLRAQAAVPVTTTATEAVRALRAVGARRVAVATPYLEWVTEAEAGFFHAAGLDVISTASLNLTDGHDMAALDATAVTDLARRVDRATADAVFLSCTDLPTLELIGGLEQRLGKPVVSSNLATLWGIIGVHPALSRLGRLYTTDPEEFR